jgi:hypothetical protein
LSYHVKENIRNYKYAKELWLQLENCYQNETQEEEKYSQSEEQELDKEDFCQNKEQNLEEENSYQDKEQDKEKDNFNHIKEHNTNKNIYDQNKMQELSHSSAITKEKLHNLKTYATVAIYEIRMEPRNYMHIKVPMNILDHIEYTIMCTFEELEKLKQLDQSNHEENEQKFHLENKEEEIKRLKLEVINITKEMEKLNTHDSKRKEVLK